MAKVIYVGDARDPNASPAKTNTLGRDWVLNLEQDIPDDDPTLERLRKNPHFTVDGRRADPALDSARVLHEAQQRAASADTMWTRKMAEGRLASDRGSLVVASTAAMAQATKERLEADQAKELADRNARFLQQAAALEANREPDVPKVPVDIPNPAAASAGVQVSKQELPDFDGDKNHSRKSKVRERIERHGGAS